VNPPPLVMVVWEDATVLDSGPWVVNADADHAYKPHLVYQVGFLLKHTEEGVHLTQAWHPDTIAARDQIPLGMIRSITPLQPAKPPRKRSR
jgi:cellulose synthase/poly-beta-1,6-N-acetylglucosamine synthase-like glycosyltransferase